MSINGSHKWYLININAVAFITTIITVLNIFLVDILI